MRERFTANIGFLFTDRPFLERIDAAGAAGFDKVECHFPYEHPIPVVRERLRAAGVALTGLNTARGSREDDAGLAGVPGRESEFWEIFTQAADYASGLGARTIHVMAGIVPPDRRGEGLATYVANVRAGARAVAERGLTLLLEPLNDRDHPGYLVSRTDEMAAILDRIGEPNVRMMFDIYHVARMGDDVVEAIRRHRDRIGHVQIAAIPSRQEPDESELPLEAVFEALNANDYNGLIGLEYRPRGTTEAGLGWMRRFSTGR